MVFYYSATGNSLWAARELAQRQGERLVCITDELKGKRPLRYNLAENETVGFVFPVHAWAPPETVLDFIGRMEVTGYTGQYVYAVATCGGECGHTMRVLGGALAKKGLSPAAAWEIAMPNNYLPMQPDSPELVREKLENAAEIMEQVNAAVAARRAETHLLTGALPHLRTFVVAPLFRRFGRSSRSFYATDTCTGCGLCQTICLKGIIVMEAGKPRWGTGCDQCFACIHRCPCQAVQFGKKTVNRGRYCHPTLRQG